MMAKKAENVTTATPQPRPDQEPVAITTPQPRPELEPAPEHDSSRAEKIRWAIRRAGGLDATTTAILAELKAHYVEFDWDTKAVHAQIGNAKISLRMRKDDGKQGVTKAMPSTEAQPARVSVASTVAQIQKLAAQVGWEELANLVTLLRPR
jgi:hypothetical protein